MSMGVFIFELIKQHFGLVFTLSVMVFVLAIWAAYHIGKKLNALSNLPCQDHDKKIDEHNADLKRYNSDISEIKGNLNALLKLQTAGALRPFIPKKADTYSQKQSPRKLNKNGLSLFKDVGGEKFIEDNKKFLFEEIDKFSPKTALDVETSALIALRINQNNDIFDDIKNWVYLEPSRTIYNSDGTPDHTADVVLDDVLFVISLPLRDAYLTMHPELVPVEEQNK